MIGRAVLIVLAAALAGCAGLGPPGDPGLYAVQDDEMRRLDGDREWEVKTWDERSVLSPGVTFLVRHPQLAATGQPADRMISLVKVAWVRSEISREGDIYPAQGQRWVDTAIDTLKVPVTLEPYADRSDVVRIVPRQRLEPGLYSLQLQTPATRLSARVGVQWPTTDQRTYSAAHCVDRYQDSQSGYRLCADQALALAARMLKIHLVEPEVRMLAGQGRQLVVTGVVVNNSQSPLRIPVLEARLMSKQGSLIKRWPITVEAAELQPGASVSFASELMNPPTDAGQVNVTFAPFSSGPGGGLASH